MGRSGSTFLGGEGGLLRKGSSSQVKKRLGGEGGCKWMGEAKLSLRDEMDWLFLSFFLIACIFFFEWGWGGAICPLYRGDETAFR